MEASRTPLYARHLALGARTVPFGGWEMPLQYSSIREEALAVRRAAGLFDVSHMGRYEVKGLGAQASLQKILTNDVGALPVGKAAYSLICREDGGIVDDVIAYKRSPEDFIVVVNAANRRKDWDWIQGHLEPETDLVDRSEELALIAFQGPAATRLLDVSRETSISAVEVPQFGFLEGVSVAGLRCELICRTGYTGEDGWELMVPAEQVEALWDRLLDTDGAVRPCGLGARDLCRLEAGLRLYGQDMDDATNPYEAGLGWTVKLDKGDFIGRSTLAEVKASGPRRSTIGLSCEGKTIPRHDAAVSNDGVEVGRVTSGSWSFLLERGIAMASIETGAVAPGETVSVDVRGHPAQAQVVRLPFYRRESRAGAPASSRKE